MKAFNSIAAVFLQDHNLTELESYLKKLFAITEYLSQEIHLFGDANELSRIRNIISELIQRGFVAPKTVVTHELDENCIEEIFNALMQYKVKLIVLPMRKEHPRFKYLLEHIRIPILLIREDTEIRTPWNELFVPISGEIQRSAALEFGLEMASRIESPISLIHVSKREKGKCTCCNGMLLETISDEFHHEYIHRMDKLLAESCPYSTLEKRKWVRELCGYTGEIAEQVTHVVEKAPNSALILEWNGILVEGHARRLREIFERAHCPILLVRTHEKMKFRLNVSERFRLKIND